MSQKAAENLICNESEADESQISSVLHISDV